MNNVNVLVVSDLHQSRTLFDQLAAAVEEHGPDVLAINGDCLDFMGRQGSQLTVDETAEFIAKLQVPQIVFTRGNHEQEDWREFVYAWPHEHRPLVALHGTAFTYGPLVIVGFPCGLGWDEPFREMLPKSGNTLTLDFDESGRKSLPDDANIWLRKLLKQIGPAGRTLWLMHEPPVESPIAHHICCNPLWTPLLECYQPLLTVSGHDHETPIRNSTWNTKLGRTTCVNVGQSINKLRYVLIEFEFKAKPPSLPHTLRISAFPDGQSIEAG